MVEASRALVQDSGKENAGCTPNKPRKKVTNRIHAQVGEQNTYALPGIGGRKIGRSHVLAPRTSNVEVQPPQAGLLVSDSSSPSACSSGDSKRVHVANSSTEFAEIGPSLPRRDQHPISAAISVSPRREERPVTRRSFCPAGGSTPAAPRQLTASSSTVAPPLEFPFSRSPLQFPRPRTAQSSAPPPPPLSSRTVPKTFCVHVRSDPTRPWRLSSSSASPNSKPRGPSHSVHMFPNPTFAPYSSAHPKPSSSGKLFPFNGFQLKPLSVPQQQDSTNTPPATVRPYLSPSRVSPKQQAGACSTPSSSVNKSCGQFSTSTDVFVGISVKSPSNERQHKVRQNNNANTKNWWSRRLSLPFSQPPMAICRFSIASTQEDSPVRPLPSLIGRLPSRRKPPQSIHSVSHQVIHSPSSPPVIETQLGRDRKTDPAVNPGTLIAPLPLPPALQLEGFKAHVNGNSARKPEPNSIHKRSLSCPRREFRPLEWNSSLEKEEEGRATLQADGVERASFTRQAVEKEPRRKILAGLDCGTFPCGSSSVWPGIRRSWSFSYERGSNSTSKCTGAGPCLVKRMKGWVHSKKSEPIQM